MIVSASESSLTSYERSKRAESFLGLSCTPGYMRSLDCAFWIVCPQFLPLLGVTHIPHFDHCNTSSMVVHMFPNKAEQRTRLIGCSVIWSLGTISGFILFVCSRSVDLSLMMSVKQRWRPVFRTLAVDLSLSSMRRRRGRTSWMATHAGCCSYKFVVDGK